MDEPKTVNIVQLQEMIEAGRAEERTWTKYTYRWQSLSVRPDGQCWWHEGNEYL